MKILELNFERTWRGGERQTLYNMQGFRAAGVPVDIVCRKGFPMEEKARKEGFATFAFSNIFGVIGFLITNGRKYDVLHAQTSHILTYCLLTKPFHGCKVTFTRRVDFVPKGRFTRLKYRLTDKVIAISHAIKRILEQFSGRDIALVSEIFLKRDLNVARAKQILQKEGVDLQKPVVATTAALVPHKDPMTMVETIRALKELRGSNFTFVHFGAGEFEVPMKAKIAEYGLQDVYKMPGFCPDVEDMFSVFDVFVMSSEEEGLGSSVLDAFAYKVPVVSTNAGGLIDLVKDGRGIVCNVKDSGALAEGIHRLLNDANLREAITERAYDYVVEAHGMAHITAQYLDVFKD